MKDIMFLYKSNTIVINIYILRIEQYIQSIYKNIHFLVPKTMHNIILYIVFYVRIYIKHRYILQNM